LFLYFGLCDPNLDIFDIFWKEK